ncbi:hypothetical protein, partial [Arcobacter sp. LA11]|uniref:glycoside hydrolase family 19 protein n=1 Tax=Arcobacter sp. LA11 TaxID=1898176 RepID=UPI002159FCBA
DKLSFFTECKDIEEFPKSDDVYHFNPIGLVGEFKTSKKGCLTKEIFDKIFPDAPENKRKEVLDLFNTYCHDFEINTPLRVAHFFAHVKAEVGKTLKGNIEDLTYKVSALKSLFGRYFNHYPNEADLYGYKGKISKAQYLSLSTLEKSKYTKSGSRYYKQVANQDEIAKRIYCCSGTDGYFLLKKGGDISGIKYKGKGFLQLTWKGNYKKVNDILKNKISDLNIDIVTNPNSILNTKEGMLSAMGFWEWQKLNEKADNGDSDNVVDSITDKINFYTKSRQKRKNYFREIYTILKD